MTKLYSLSELADRCGATIQGDPNISIRGLNTLQDAQQDQLSFLANPAYAKYLANTQAGAVILSPAMAETFSGNALILKDPYYGYAQLSSLFDDARLFEPSIHKTAVIDETVQLGHDIHIGAQVVIEAGVQIGNGVRIEAGSVVGKDSILAEDVHLCRNVTVCHGVMIGARTIIHSGAVIGGDGFGNAHVNGRWHKIAQIGGVVIGADVEIGNNTCIDRGALGNTEIHDGVRIDNLVQIAHNVIIGENTAIAANSGVSGSTKIGKHCIIAGASGFAGHLTIADGTFVSGMSMVTRSITKAGAYSSGTGLMESRDWRKSVVHFRNLDDMVRRIKVLEKNK